MMARLILSHIVLLHFATLAVLFASNSCIVSSATPEPVDAAAVRERAAEERVAAALEVVLGAVQAAFDTLGIEDAKIRVDEQGKDAVLSGWSEDRDAQVTVELERLDSDSTSISVTARKARPQERGPEVAVGGAGQEGKDVTSVEIGMRVRKHVVFWDAVYASMVLNTILDRLAAAESG